MLNQIHLIGRLVADPTTAKSNKGTAVLSFRVANNLTKEVTLFIDCKAFGKTAEACAKILHKGSNNKKWFPSFFRIKSNQLYDG